ncbi:MAG: bifunctional riboflavin kinase/FAD synthetase [Nitrospiraceae bacterium]
MKVTRSLAGYRPPPAPVATIGNFDGQHRGHQALLRTVVETAARAQGTPVVITFDPHPVRILAPHVSLKFLTSPDDKLAAFEAAGIAEVVYLPFSQEFAARSPESFAREILAETLGLTQVFVGEHFAFGAKRAGRIDDLRRFGAQWGFSVHPIVPVVCDGAVISSTRIRAAIHDGRMEEAAQCLGRWYAWSGPVIEGAQRGRELGWPTANLAVPSERVVPRDGVYAARTWWGARRFDSIVYLGTRPTFETDGPRLLEVHLLDEQRALYGETVRVEFVSFLRADATFATPEALQAQIARDIDGARGVLRAAPTEPIV